MRFVGWNMSNQQGRYFMSKQKNFLLCGHIFEFGELTILVFSAILII